MTSAVMPSEITALSRKVVERANAIHNRLKTLEEQFGKELVPTIRRVSKNKSKWVVLYNEFREFGLVLAWQQLLDRDSVAMLRWTTRGHDIRVSVSLSYLETELALTDQINQALRVIGSDPELSQDASLSVSAFARDMLNAELSGKIRIRGVPFDFATSITLLPVAEGSSLFLRLGRKPNIYLSGTGQVDRIDIQRKLVGELNKLFRNRPIEFGQATSVGGMALKSVHTDLSLTLYYAESLPRSPVTRVLSGTDKPATPEGWEDIIVAMTDDHVADLISREDRLANPNGRTRPAIGYLRYEQDPRRPGHWLMRIAVRRDIERGGTVDLGWFGSFRWRFQRISWPEFLFGFRSEVVEGSRLKVFGTFFFNDQKLGESALLDMPSVHKARESVDPGKSYDVRIAFKRGQ